ncbi:S-adenosyl-l-methionine hydroxide adenosyltransferase family protein [Candidatus Latescibacterota bacterium]
MTVNGIITITTDFGNRDPYSGIMKGMILGANPCARIIDITHEIPAHDIIYAAFTILRSYKHFPEGTVHIAVVDPGVGGGRKNIVVKTDRYLFIGPDNGIFSRIIEKEKSYEIREIKNPPFILDKVSNTFHGRDVFAPCAGHLSAGKPFSEVGPIIKKYKKLGYPKVDLQKNILKGEVVSVDSFGNLITNINESTFHRFAGRKKVEIYFAAQRFDNIMRRYTDVPVGSLLILFGSIGYLEISMNEGSAESYFRTSVGSPVTIRKL